MPYLMLVPYYVYRFFQPKYSVGVIGVVLNERSEVLLVEHVFHPRRPWGLPGGWIGFNEDPTNAIIREMREELHLDVVVESLLLMKRTQYNHLDIAFLCITEGQIGNVSYELLGFQWVSQHNLPPLHHFHYEAIRAAFALQSGK
jgi:8-oxo-dGTP pyrophosphatase MutT (NUDIX family)